MSHVAYLYAFVEAGREAAKVTGLDILGIDESSVSLLNEGLIAAAVSELSAVEFDESALNERIKDLEWLAPRALAHQHVNSWLFERFEAVLPLSFGAVFRSREGVVDLIRREHAAFLARLDRVRGRGEWVIALSREDSRVLSWLDEGDELVRSLRVREAASSPGRAYLLRRQIEAARLQGLAASDSEAMSDLADIVANTGGQMFQEPIAKDVPGAPIARASVLVARSSEDQIVGALDDARQRWRTRGYQIEITGPWPPYRFGGIDEEAGHV